jgi:hypothetical protein
VALLLLAQGVRVVGDRCLGVVHVLKDVIALTGAREGDVNRELWPAILSVESTD